MKDQHKKLWSNYMFKNPLQTDVLWNSANTYTKFLKRIDISSLKQKKLEDLNGGIRSFDRVFLMKRNFGIEEALATRSNQNRML